ncbi:MAG: hypothetical protein H0X42_01510 [Solirubrobacterales bacterium]|nr:hypothetical protein [Solirubrobacterales bacterium]
MSQDRRPTARALALVATSVCLLAILAAPATAAQRGDRPLGGRPNRNFPYAWQHLGGLEYSGPHALSEPESRAAVELIRRVRPDLTIWFHQPFGVVDRSGGDPWVERSFAGLVGLPLVRLSRYPGSATGWQDHTLPGTAFVVELPSAVSGGLVRRTSRAILTLAGELGSPEVGAATAAVAGP